jgi:hypothetical protein
MTDQHRATPEQWDSIERCADGSDPYSCILELRARIEALEAAQQPRAFTGKVVAPIKAPITRDRDETGNYLIVHDTPALASSLVERVATDAELCKVYNDAPDHCGPALRAVYDLGREHGAVPIRSGPESPLVERVADAIAAQATSAGIVNDRPARAAILKVAAWLTENYARDVASPPPCQMLRNEVNQ